LKAFALGHREATNRFRTMAPEVKSVHQGLYRHPHAEEHDSRTKKAYQAPGQEPSRPTPAALSDMYDV
jgi:hypothetical protein